MPPNYRVTYRQSSGETLDNQHLLLLAATPIDTLAPIRPPNNYRGQRHITGLHYSPTTGLHHAFESRLEQSALIRIDFEIQPKALATQPFALLYDDQGKRRGHIPDVLIDRQGDRPLVIDVKPKAFVQNNIRPFSALQDACTSIGWDYAIWTELDPTYASNIAFLYGYHRPLPHLTPIVELILDRLTSGPILLIQITDGLGALALVRPLLFHLMWKRVIYFDPYLPLKHNTLISIGVD